MGYTPIYNDLLGRIGRIADRVYMLSNDLIGGTITTNRFSNTNDILISINACYAEIAQEDYWVKNNYIDFKRGITEYDLSVLMPNLVTPLKVVINDTSYELMELSDWTQYATALKYLHNSDTVQAWLIGASILRLSNAPSKDIDGAVWIYYSYMPPQIKRIILDNTAVVNNGDGTVKIAATNHNLEANDEIDISGTTNYNGNYRIISVGTDYFNIVHTYIAETISSSARCYNQPRTPEALDDIYVNFCMRERLLKDASNSRLGQQYQIFEMQYRQYKLRLLENRMPQRLRLRPIR